MEHEGMKPECLHAGMKSEYIGNGTWVWRNSFGYTIRKHISKLFEHFKI